MKQETVRFTKMHGAGNDYIYVYTPDYPIENPVEKSIEWSKPHFGIGSDGLILIGKSDVADFSMHIYNNDGSEAMMCGNGTRCVGKYVYDHHLTNKTTISLDTLAGIKIIHLLIEDGKCIGATVDMGEPRMDVPQQFDAKGHSHTGDHVYHVDGYDGTFVSMGNPHFVIFVSEVMDMDIAEEFVKYLLNWALTNCKEDMAFFDQRIQKGLIETLTHVVNSDFVRISYTDAIKELEKNNDKFEFKAFWGCDLQTEHERYLTEQTFKKPVMVYDYPKEIKAFYMKQNPDGKTVAAVDCLVPGVGEIMGGSQREEDYDKLFARMKELGLDPEGYQFYLDLRKYGTVRHSGFGLGFERALMYITGMQNIRDVLPFPRTPGNCEL